MRCVSRFLLLCAFAYWSGVAQAGPILVGPATAAAGFLNLEIDGFLYDVTFHGNDSIFDVYSSLSEIAFYQDPAKAELAINALADALTVNNVSGISNFIPGSFFGDIIVGFPYDYSTPFPPNVYINSNIAALDTNTMTWSTQSVFVPGGAEGVVYSIATFKPSDVVEVSTPSTLLLVVAGSLAAVRSRKWKSAHST